MENKIVSFKHNTLESHLIYHMPKDGSCMFHSLSQSMYGNVYHTSNIRSRIVQHIYDNWEQYQAYTCDEHGQPYSDRVTYFREMSKESTYGSVCELMAAGDIFPFTFEVYKKNELKGRFSSNNGGQVRRLRFSGADLSGHYDVLVPVETDDTVKNAVIKIITIIIIICISFYCFYK